MSLEWEAISGVSGVISAAVAVYSVVDISRNERRNEQQPNSSISHLNMYLLFCSGWVLCVLAFNWCFEPFGSYLTKWDYQKLYGVMLSVPAVTLTLFAARRLIP